MVQTLGRGLVQALQCVSASPLVLGSALVLVAASARVLAKGLAPALA
jgi:hypothetical protein